jgi:hypothetical protein
MAAPMGRRSQLMPWLATFSNDSIGASSTRPANSDASRIAARSAMQPPREPPTRKMGVLANAGRSQPRTQPAKARTSSE